MSYRLMRVRQNISKVPIRNSNDLGIFIGIIGWFIFSIFFVLWLVKIFGGPAGVIISFIAIFSVWKLLRSLGPNSFRSKRKSERNKSHW